LDWPGPFEPPEREEKPGPVDSPQPDKPNCQTRRFANHYQEPERIEISFFAFRFVDFSPPNSGSSGVFSNRESS
jgi:hypothetical protein